jgi:hypothetical protein
MEHYDGLGISIPIEHAHVALIVPYFGDRDSDRPDLVEGTLVVAMNPLHRSGQSLQPS